jgi:cellulose synthase/poly-beta-1,6-N-acetylglucosamine synthase-like glycosyltransferase
MTSAESAPRLSVIIPVYRDWDDLRRCLAALAQQTWPAGDFEILVVNNDTQPAPGDLVAQIGRAHV